MFASVEVVYGSGSGLAIPKRRADSFLPIAGTRVGNVFGQRVGTNQFVRALRDGYWAFRGLALCQVRNIEVDPNNVV